MKINVCEKITDGELSGNADQFIERLRGKIEETGVPAEKLYMCIGTETGYHDNDYGVIELHYSREETPQEKAVREDRADRQRQYELREFERLKAKLKL